MNSNRNIRKQVIIFSILLILVFTSSPIITIFSNNVWNDLDEELRTSGDTWTVDDDGPSDFNTIQEAIDAASAGDFIIIYPGNYTENIEVNKSLSITSASETEKPKVQPLDMYEPVFNITSDEVNVSKIEINGGGGYYGFYLDNVQRCNIFEIVANTYKQYLVYLFQSSYNTIRNINFSNGYNLLGSYYSHYNKISNNSIKDCQNLISLSGDHNLIENNFIESTYSIGGFVGSYNEFINNTCYYTGGISIAEAFSSFNIVANNEIKKQNIDPVSGIYIRQEASNNIIKNNRISEFEYGITISTNAYENVIVNNSIFDCNIAVNLDSNSNYIYSNDLFNSNSGLRFGVGNFNHIYSNNFVNSEGIHIIVSTYGLTNYWHSPSQLDYYYQDIKYTNYFGNYFDDYDDLDENCDGLGDNPYDIHSYTDDQDEYPLMIPFQHYRKSLPLLDTRKASDITGTATTLNSEIISIGGSIILKRRFEWGTTPDCGEYWTDSVSIPSRSDYEFYFRLTDLEPDTTYYFRAWAKNTNGWNKGNTQSFTTLRAPKEWIVDDDGPANFSTIQEAIDIATPGDTILVNPGTYIENIQIDKIVNIISSGGYGITTLIAANPDFPVFELRANHIQITGFTIKNSTSPHTSDIRGTAIYTSHLVYVSYITISYNYITNNYIGITLYNAEYCLIEQNVIVNNQEYGIYSCEGTKFIEIIDNYIDNNSCGITLYGLSTEKNSVIGNQILAGHTGIWIFASSNNLIQNNTIDSNSENGIYLQNRVNYNRLSNNKIIDSHYGVRLVGISYWNIIEYNQINNNEYGITMQTGGSAEYQRYNKIRYNVISNNFSGIHIFSERIENNEIYLNNFNNIYDYHNNYGQNYTNIFNSPEIAYNCYGLSLYGYLGNFWNNYLGTDADLDGIGDLSYHIWGNDYDYYPLIQPFQNYILSIEDKTPPETEIKISPWRTINFNDVTFIWTGKDDLTPSEALEFQFKLEGYDDNWSGWTTQNSVTYYDLPYGVYTFWVMARDLARNIEEPPKSRIFSYTPEKESIKSLLYQIESDILEILDRALFNYASMMLTLKSLIDNYPEYNALEFTKDILLTLAQKIKDFKLLPFLKSLNLEPLPQIPESLEFILDSFKYWDIPLIILNIFLSIMENRLGKNINDIISYEEDLVPAYNYLLSEEVGVFDIMDELYEVFAIDNIKNNIKSSFEALLIEIKDSIYIDSDYLENLLWDIKRELTQVRDYDRKILILEDNKYIISVLNEYKTSLKHYYDNIKIGSDIVSICEIIGGVSTITGFILHPTGLVGASCQIISLLGSFIEYTAKTYVIHSIAYFYSTMLQGTYIFLNLFETLKRIASDINEIVVPYLKISTIHYDGKILFIETSNFWNEESNHYMTYFDVTIKNQGTEKVKGTIAYHVRSLKENLNLADINYKEFIIEPKEIKTITLKSLLPISWIGGDYIANIEFWLGSDMVDHVNHIFYVENIGGLLIKEFQEGILDMSDSLRFFFDSIGNSQPSIIINEYEGSEINLHVYDSSRNHLGINYITGELENEIPGAEYSGLLNGYEWAILPPGQYEINLFCIDAHMEGVRFNLNEITFLPSPGILGITPSRIMDYAESGEFLQTTVILKELSKLFGIEAINITVSALTNSDGISFSIDPFPYLLTLLPGESKILTLNISIPLNLPVGIYYGNISILAVESSNGTQIRLIIPISITLFSSYQELPQIDFSNIFLVLMISTIILMIIIIKKRKLIE